MSKLLFTIFLVLPIFALAQLNTRHLVAECQVCYPTDLKSVDIDSDGDEDLFSASFKDKKIAWYENDGAGNFSQQKIISNSTAGVVEIFLEDIDGDGHTDILYPSTNFRNQEYYQTQIIWHKNDGNGNFSMPKISSAMSITTRRIQVADVDQDGDVDILYASTEDEIVWLKNNGEGDFSDKTIVYENARNPKSIAIADIDQDGDKDIITFYKEQIVWYSNNGDNEFPTWRSISVEIEDLIDVYTHDLDSDGDEDILFYSYSTGLAWYENYGNAWFSSYHLYINTHHSFARPYLADLDNDNDLDILYGISSYYNNEMTWYENDGAGNFSDSNLISEKTDSLTVVYAMDVDGDNDLDPVSASIIGSEIAWYENDGAANFSDQHIIIAFGRFIRNIQTGDMDGDGDIDIVSSALRESILAWYQNDGSGKFSSSIFLSDKYPSNSDIPVQLIDFDKDNDLDILTIEWLEVVWYENDGIGNFIRHPIDIHPEQRFYYLIAANLDEDDMIDLVLAEENKLIQYTNNGDGTFNKKNIFSDQEFKALTIQVFDLDYDGHLDIISNMLGNVIWFRNDGFGNFSLPEDVGKRTTGGVIENILIADLNNDTWQDIIFTTLFNYNISWIANRGTGRFSSTQNIAVDIGWVGRSEVADIDQDGDLDIVSFIEGFENALKWYENDGVGNFELAQTIDTEIYGQPSLQVADIDGDSDTDIIISKAGREGDIIAWYENETITSVENTLEHATIRVYPNPFQEQVTFEFQGQQVYQIHIFDSLGKLLYNTIIAENNYQLDMQPLASSLYFYQILDKSGTLLASGKLVKSSR